MMILQDPIPSLLVFFLSFSSCSSPHKTPFFFLSSFYSWLLFFKLEEMRKNVFYKLFLLASSHALVWFWCVKLERKTRKVFGWKESEESGFMITLLSKLRCKPNSSQLILTLLIY